MRRFKKILLVLLIVINVTYIAMPTEVLACYYSDGTISQEELDKDIRYWWQGRVPADNSLITGESGSDTIGAGACSHFSMTYALVKMGIFNPKSGDTPITHIQNARDKDAFLVDWGYFDFSRVNELYPDVTYEGRDDNVSGMSGDEGLAYVRGKMSEGYYVVGIVYGDLTSGHCIFFDGINEDGTMSIGDSAFYGITWEESYGNCSTYFSYLELLKCKGKDFNSQPSIYDENALRGTTQEEVAEYEGLLQEWNLSGMPRKTNLTEGLIQPQFYDYSYLTQEELDNMQAIKEIKDGDKLTFFQVVKTIISCLGVLVIVYALLLLLAYMFDRVNSFVDLSLVGVLTLGHIKVADRADLVDTGIEEPDKQGYMTPIKLFVIVGVLLLLGVLLITGGLSSLIYRLIQGSGVML